MIDYWKLTRDFKIGDVVQKFMSGRGGELSPYYGRVTAVMPGIGFVDVQWPFDNERVSPEDLVKLNPEFLTYLPPSLDFSNYAAYDKTSKVASELSWNTAGLPIGFHRELARLYHKGASEVQSYDDLWHRFASFSDDDALRNEIQKFYRFASNAMGLLVDQVADKTATYWAAQNRQHRATKSEVSAKKPNCPKCGSAMRKATYKMAEGQRIRLFACPKDLYLIKQEHILGPEGEPVSW